MSFNIALSGLNAATTELGSISNNIANANTTGFKGSRVEFGDFFRVATYDLSGVESGAGVRVQRVAQQFGQGTVNNTGNALDLAISGDGFFTLSDGGSRVYSRGGAFGTDRDGFVVNSSGQRLQVYPPAGTAGSFNTAMLSDLRLNSLTNPPSATTSIGTDVNLSAEAEAPATAPFSATDPSSYNHTTSLTVYDSLGSAHTASLFFVRGAAAGEWTTHVTVDGTAVGSGEAMSFDSSGNLVTPAGGQLTLPDYTPDNGSAPLSLTVDLASASQYGDTFTVGTLSQDGYATGTLSGLAITGEGVVQARHTNGQVTPLGQIAMSNFPNQQGLQQLGNTGWAETFVSGQPVLGTAGSSNFGSIQAGALEASNVDLTEQLVNMMTAQRNYQANSQVISTEDQLLQSIMNLR